MPCCTLDSSFFFFFNDTATTEIYTLSLHDALPIYRAALDGPARFERCGAGLPEWFDANIDSGCLAAEGETVAFGTADGTLFRSADAGATWTEAAGGLPAVLAVTFV